tara:strand:+ start:76 stop:699 length:624 start_codon:yes stop_codon:yes gene_type:complete
MIKFLAVLIFTLIISSCSGISYQQVYPLLKQATVGAPDFIVTQEFINKKKFSFIKARFGKGRPVIMVLAGVDDSNIFQWISAKGEMLYTLNGKVIRSYGLPFNISYLRNVSPVFNTPGLIKTPLKLMNPNAYVTNNLLTTSEGIETLNFINPIKVKKYIIRSTINELNWSKENIYYLDLNTNYVIKTTQYLHPNLPKLEIEFYFKFS